MIEPSRVIQHIKVLEEVAIRTAIFFNCLDNSPEEADSSDVRDLLSGLGYDLDIVELEYKLRSI